MKPLVIGVDGGGSRTRVLLADITGQEVASGEGRGSAVRSGDAREAAGVIADAVGRTLEPVGKATVRILVVGVAGVGRPQEREELTQALERLGLADDVVVVPDAEIALEDAFGEGSGVVLTAGTGSIAFGRGPTGTLARSGGWGPVFGDEGSGAWIGRRALGIVTASYDGREPETSLTEPLLAAAGVSEPSELVAWAARATPADLARLTPTVFEVAATGDLRANSLVTLAVEELGLHVRALARLLFGDERAAFALAFNGGLLTRGTLIRRRLEQRLRSMTPGAQPIAADVIPARGAVRLGLREAGLIKPLLEVPTTTMPPRAQTPAAAPGD